MCCSRIDAHVATGVYDNDWACIHTGIVSRDQVVADALTFVATLTDRAANAFAGIDAFSVAADLLVAADDAGASTRLAAATGSADLAKCATAFDAREHANAAAAYGAFVAGNSGARIFASSFAAGLSFGAHHVIARRNAGSADAPSAALASHVETRCFDATTVFGAAFSVRTERFCAGRAACAFGANQARGAKRAFVCLSVAVVVGAIADLVDGLSNLLADAIASRTLQYARSA